MIASRRSRGGVCGMSPILLKIGRVTRGNLKSCQEPIFLRLVACWVMWGAFCAKIEKWFFGRNSFPLGFMKKLVCIWYQDLRLGYAHVKFQPDRSNSVDFTATGRSETFAALAFLCLHGSPSNFVCSNASALRSF